MTIPETVSVVIPAYNGERFIGEAIESCIAQTHPPKEIIVVDDGSTDNTAAVAQRYASHVQVICQANRGEGAARNRGIDTARGEWVAFLDADDRWEPNKLERQMAACASDDIVACHTNFVNFGAHCEPFDGRVVPDSIRYSLPYMAVHGPILPSTLLVRRDLPIRFPEHIDASVDTIYCLQLVRLGRVELVAQPLVHYRKHSASLTARSEFLLRANNNVMAWLEANRCDLPEEDYRTIRSGLLQIVVDRAKRAKWLRKWADYDQIRSFLKRYSNEPVVSSYMRRFTWPRSCYSAKDLIVGKLLASSTRGSESKAVAK